MAKTQKQIDEFFKSKKEQEQTLQPRSQMILNDEPLPSSIKKKDLLKKNYKFKTTHELWDTITELESDIQQWISFNKDKEHQIYLLEQELKEYRKLQSEVHKDIQRVWEIDSADDWGSEEKQDIIESVFYKIANEWID